MYDLNPTDLSSYPGVKIPNDNVLALVKKLTEGKINAVLRAVLGDTFTLTGAQRDDIDPIAFEAAARALRNPTGATSITTGIDDWKQTLRYEGEVALSRRAGVYLTDDEARDVRRAVAPPQPSRKRSMSIGLRVPGVAGYGHRY